MRTITKIVLSTVLAVAATTSFTVASAAEQGAPTVAAGHGCCR
jgi:hypothetical protein